MPQLILHHYPTSPFAEKVRLILGYKGLAWTSCVQPVIMPKDELQALTGGYRRIPVLQIGADVYCDTLLIADELERLQPAQTLYPQGFEGVARVFAQWADSTLFAAGMAYNFSPRGAQSFFAQDPRMATQPEQVMAFAKTFAQDRAAMRGGAPRMHPAEAASAYRAYLLRIADTLGDQPYVFGAAPNVADFSAYHTLWFTRQIPSEAPILGIAPQILPWMDRLAAYNLPAQDKITPTKALAVALQNTPQSLTDLPFVNEHGIALGEAVTLTAESFGLEATQGTLVAATEQRYTLRREHPLTGTVHVHFPRLGFVLKKAV